MSVKVAALVFPQATIPRTKDGESGTCLVCKGAKVVGQYRRRCADCLGTGKRYKACPNCGGTGTRVWRIVCPTCKGVSVINHADAMTSGLGGTGEVPVKDAVAVEACTQCDEKGKITKKIVCEICERGWNHKKMIPELFCAGNAVRFVKAVSQHANVVPPIARTVRANTKKRFPGSARCATATKTSRHWNARKRKRGRKSERDNNAGPITGRARGALERVFRCGIGTVRAQRFPDGAHRYRIARHAEKAVLPFCV